MSLPRQVIGVPSLLDHWGLENTSNESGSKLKLDLYFQAVQYIFVLSIRIVNECYNNRGKFCIKCLYKEALYYDKAPHFLW